LFLKVDLVDLWGTPKVTKRPEISKTGYPIGVVGIP